MLTHLFPFLDPDQISSGLASRLRALADDCERLSFDRHVPPAVLEQASLLEDWVPVLTQTGLHLVGYAVGHPVRGNRMVMTPPLWWADPDCRWARTLSRFYRLGPPADPNVARHLRELVGSDGSEDEA
jgi:hypothetical protein